MLSPNTTYQPRLIREQEQLVRQAIDYRSHPILYLDPEPNNLQRFRLSFADEHRVHTTSSPSEGLRILDEEPVSVLVVEAGGPGFELGVAARRLRPEIIRLAVGCTKEDDSLRQAMDAGFADALVGKPWEVDELRASLRGAIERFHLEEELRSLRLQLQRTSKLSSLSFATAGIAHDMKTPLTSLMTGLELLGKRVARLKGAGGLASEVAEEINPVLRACRQSTQQLRTLMEGVRSQLQERPMELLSLEQIVAQTLLLCESEVRSQANLEVELHQAPRVRGEAPQLIQLLLNLVQNALQAMAALPVERRSLRLLVESCGEGALLQVEDSGEGVPEGLYERLFEPFFSTREEGSGLGLAIAKEIVEKHGATMDFLSPEGGGTAVRLIFPAG